MSRNRRKTSSAPIPEEVLADGSGPHADPSAELEVDAELLAAAASEALSESESESEPLAESESSLSEAEALSEPETESELVALLPTSAATMDSAQLKHLVEALVFAADRPITLQRLRQLTRIADIARLEQALAELAEDFRDRGISLQQVSGGYQFRTNTNYSVWVQQLIAGRPVRLSRAQLETLAIVAYRQPITRPEIDDIRGVDSSATLRILLDRTLIRILGKREEAGRPILYGTTKEFLDFFSLGDLREMPTLREYSELSAESRQVMSDRLGIPLDHAPDQPIDSLGATDLASDQATDHPIDQEAGVQTFDTSDVVDDLTSTPMVAEAAAQSTFDAEAGHHDVDDFEDDVVASEPPSDS